MYLKCKITSLTKCPLRFKLLSGKIESCDIINFSVYNKQFCLFSGNLFGSIRAEICSVPVDGIFPFRQPDGRISERIFRSVVYPTISEIYKPNSYINNVDSKLTTLLHLIKCINYHGISAGDEQKTGEEKSPN